MRAIEKQARRAPQPASRRAAPVQRDGRARGALDASGLLWLQRMAGNRAATAVVQRIEETHAWIQALGVGNQKRVMAANSPTTSDWLTKIGDFFVSKGFKVHDSKGNNMAFLKDGTMEEAIKDATSFGMTMTPKSAKNMHSKKPATLYTDTTLRMNLRPFSASSQDTIAVVEFMVDPCRFEFKYTNNAEAIAAGHYGTPSSTTTPPSDESK